MSVAEIATEPAKTGNSGAKLADRQAISTSTRSPTCRAGPRSMNAAFRTGPVELPSRTGRSRSVATCRSSGRSGGPSVGRPSHERSPRARIARSRSMVPGRRTRSGTVISSLAAVSVSIERRRLSVAGSTAQESSGLFWSRPMGSAFAAKVSGASSGQCRSLGATRRHAAIARSVPPEAAYRGPTRSVDRDSPLSREQVKRHLHGSPCHEAVLHLVRHAQPRPRPGGICVTADLQLAFALEDVDDRRSSRRVLRELLTGGKGEEQELDVSLIRERLAEDAAGRNGRLRGQVGEQGVGRGHVSTRCELPDRDYPRAGDVGGSRFY